MTFAEPGALFGLLLVPVVAALYARSRRRRRRRRRRTAVLGAQGFVTTGAPARARRRQSLSLVLLALGLIVLVIACARPMAAVATPRRSATVVLAIDVSNSMAATDADPSRIAAAKAAASAFVRQQPSSVRIGVVAFGQSALIVQPPTTDHGDDLHAIDQLSVGGGTSLAAGILSALDAIAGKTLKVNLGALAIDNSAEASIGYYGGATIVLISDGEDTTRTSPVTMARLASTAGVRIQTIGVGSAAGTTVHIGGFTVATTLDAATLQSVAQITNGTYHHIGEPGAVGAVSKTIELRFSILTTHTEITALFAAAAALLLAAGAAVSVLSFGRVV
jgi:Ca-activated chloride channel family protein